MPHLSQNNRSALKALGAILAVLFLIAIAFIPWVGDAGYRRALVFIYALLAVILGVVRMALTIWMHRDETPGALAHQERKHANDVLLLDVFTVVFGAPAALLGALTFLGPA